MKGGELNALSVRILRGFILSVKFAFAGTAGAITYDAIHTTNTPSGAVLVVLILSIFLAPVFALLDVLDDAATRKERSSGVDLPALAAKRFGLEESKEDE